MQKDRNAMLKRAVTVLVKDINEASYRSAKPECIENFSKVITWRHRKLFFGQSNCFFKSFCSLLTEAIICVRSSPIAYARKVIASDDVASSI